MPVSVRDFNAIGDGVTDDTDAFENCLKHAAARKPEQAVFVPEGKYRLTRTLTQNNGPIKYIFGVHPDLSVITGDFPGYLFEAYNSTHLVQNLGFISSATSPNNAVTMGIDLTTNGCHWGVYENLSFERLRQAIIIGSGSTANSFYDIAIQTCGSDATYALDAKGGGSDTLLFHNLKIGSNRDWPVRGAHFRGSGITIIHFDLEQIFHVEAAVFAAEGCTVNGGYLEHGLNNDEWLQTPAPQTPPPLHHIQIHQRTTFNGVLLNCMIDTSRAPAHFIGCPLFAGPDIFLPFHNYSTTNCDF